MIGNHIPNVMHTFGVMVEMDNWVILVYYVIIITQLITKGLALDSLNITWKIHLRDFLALKFLKDTCIFKSKSTKLQNVLCLIELKSMVTQKTSIYIFSFPQINNLSFKM